MDNMPLPIQDNLMYMADRGYQPIHTYISDNNPYDDNNRQCIVYYLDIAGNVVISQYIDGGDVQIQYISYYQLNKIHNAALACAKKMHVNGGGD